jgi:metal-sulfur cluster biosynthetic enzyme
MAGDACDVEDIWTALRSVIDPEIGLDIVTLGLVFDVVAVSSAADAGGRAVRITHTLTTRGCPMERAITDGMRNAVSEVAGVTELAIILVWDPVWHTGMIAPGAW